MAKKQSMASRLHESLGERHKGKKKPSLTARTHESEGMEMHAGKGPFAALKALGVKAKKKMSKKK